MSFLNPNGKTHRQRNYLLNPSGASADSFPEFVSSAATALSFSTTYTPTIPAGSVGDLIVVLIGNQFSGFTVDTAFSGLNWTTWPTTFSNGGSARVSMFLKIAEGGDAIRGTGGLDWRSGLVLRFSNVLDVSCVTVGSVGTATLNPPSYSPAGGSRKYMWVACTGQLPTTNVLRTFTAAPTGYTLKQTAGADATNKPMVGIGYQQIEAATEDAGAFTVNLATAGHAEMIAISSTP